jgi:hypothetical protein
MSASTIDSSNEDANTSISTLTILICRWYCTFNKDSCVSCIIWKGNALRSQLENDRVLKAYFLSSLVGYSAKLTCIIVVPQNILSKNAISDLREISPVDRGNLSNTGDEI